MQPASLIDRFLLLAFRGRWRGFWRLQRLLKGRSAPGQLVAATRYGGWFHLHPNHYIDAIVIREGYYESEIIEALRPFLGPAAVLWDIGSNFGLHAVTVKLLSPATRVVSVEPSPVMVARIFANAALNSVDIGVVGIALTRSAGFETLHLADGNPGMTTLKPWDGVNYDDVYRQQLLCWCDTADNLVLQDLVASPTVIKLDVEGSELEVLQGMTSILAGGTLRAIIFEGGANLLDNPADPIHSLLVATGFEIRKLARREGTEHNLENFLAERRP